MTIQEIGAILAILIAFNVPQATVANVSSILTATLPEATSTPVVVPSQQTDPTEQTIQPDFGSTNTQQDTQAGTPVPVVQSDQSPKDEPPAPDPFTVSEARITPGGYLSVYANHAFTVTTSFGTLGRVLVDNEMDTPPGEHSYDYLIRCDDIAPGIYGCPLYRIQKPYTVTLTDDAGQTYTKSFQ